MNYVTAANSIFAKGTRKNGYNGGEVTVGFALDRLSGRVYCVHATGCHWAGFTAESEAEALAQLKTAQSQYWNVGTATAVPQV